jgi:hypothetical protein
MPTPRSHLKDIGSVTESYEYTATHLKSPDAQHLFSSTSSIPLRRTFLFRLPHHRREPIAPALCDNLSDILVTTAQVEPLSSR